MAPMDSRQLQGVGYTDYHQASIETGKEVERTSEINYRFRLSAFRDQLLQFYEDNPTFITPQTRMKDIVQAVTSGLEDLSISRPSSRLTWGIPVPGDSSQTVYVWLDALLNYITKIGYPWPPNHRSTSGWPADLQIIGKDITRFHCIYWPAFLLALSLPPPKQILAHAHWTLGREKMAKSTGNVVNPFFAIDRFGVDTIRYYLALEGGLSQDSDYGNEYIVDRYKKGLQGGLGNLSTRVLRGKGWNVRQAVEMCSGHGKAVFEKVLDGDEASRTQAEMLRQVSGKVADCFEKLNAGAALKEVMSVVYHVSFPSPFPFTSPPRPSHFIPLTRLFPPQTNAFLQHAQPWSLAPKPSPNNATPRANPTSTIPTSTLNRLNAIIYLAAEAIRIVAILLQPYMPGKMAELFEMLGVEEGRRGWEDARLGKNGEYGVSRVDLGRGIDGALFPPLVAEG